MENNIDKKPGFKIAGLAYTLENRSDAQAIIDEFYENYKDRGLEDFGAFYGLMQYNALNQNYDYFVGFELADEEIISDLGFEVREVAESIYLELGVEANDLEAAYDYAYEKFFPNKKYFHGLGPDVEFYQYNESDNEIGNITLYICLKLNPHAEI